MKTDVGDVLESMDDMVTSLSTFLKSIGDNKGEATFTHLREKCTGTRQGDKDSELENVPTFRLTPMWKMPHFAMHKAMYSETLEMVGIHLGDQAMKNVNLGLCSYLSWIAREAFPERDLKGQNISPPKIVHFWRSYVC